MELRRTCKTVQEMAAFAINSDEGLLAAACRDGCTHLWKVPGLSAMETVKTHAPHESVIGLHSVGSWVYIVNEAHGMIRMHDEESIEVVLSSQRAHAGPVLCSALHRQCCEVATAGADRIKLWHIGERCALRLSIPVRRKGSGPVSSVASRNRWSHRSALGGDIFFWNRLDGEPMLHCPAPHQPQSARSRQQRSCLTCGEQGSSIGVWGLQITSNLRGRRWHVG